MTIFLLLQLVTSSVTVSSCELLMYPALQPPVVSNICRYPESPLHGCMVPKPLPEMTIFWFCISLILLTFVIFGAGPVSRLLGIWGLPDDGIDPRLCEQLEIISAPMSR